MVNLSRRRLFKGGIKNIHSGIRLPYVINEQIFITHCTQCEDCITACPEHIVVKGEGNFPEIDFSKGECTFCKRCVNVCEAPIFNKVENEEPWDLAIEIKASCLALNNVVCRSCEDSCETEAISFKYLQSSIPQPQILLDSCNGCGACVSTCPQSSIELSPQTKFLNTIGEAHERS